jgi:hypothetical protein
MFLFSSWSLVPLHFSRIRKNICLLWFKKNWCSVPVCWHGRKPKNLYLRLFLIKFKMTEKQPSGTERKLIYEKKHVIKRRSIILLKGLCQGMVWAFSYWRSTWRVLKPAVSLLFVRPTVRLSNYVKAGFISWQNPFKSALSVPAQIVFNFFACLVQEKNRKINIKFTLVSWKKIP